MILLNLISASDAFDDKRQFSYYLLHVIRSRRDLDDGPKRVKGELGSTSSSCHRDKIQPCRGTSSLCLLSVLHSSPK